AAIEPRWDDPSLPDQRAGDRLYVVTGSELRAYDLRDRNLIAAFPVPGASSVAVDTTGHRVFVGTTDGTIVEIDTDTSLDQVRAGMDARLLPDPQPVGKVDQAL